MSTKRRLRGFLLGGLTVLVIAGCAGGGQPSAVQAVAGTTSTAPANAAAPKDPSLPGEVTLSQDLDWSAGQKIRVEGVENGTKDHKVVLSLAPSSGGPWNRVAVLAVPYPSHDFLRGGLVEIGDITGDGVPEVLVQFQMASSTSSAIATLDKTGWHWILASPPPPPYGTGNGGPSLPGHIFTGNIFITGIHPSLSPAGILTTDLNDCTPSCAHGSRHTYQWHYHPDEDYVAINPQDVTITAPGG